MTTRIDDSTHRPSTARSSLDHGTRAARRAAALIVVTLGIAVAAVGCTPRSTTHWDGQPWTNSHPEPCRRYEPITWDWVAAHPDSPCAQITQLPGSAELGPACSLEKGGPLVCTEGASG